MINRKIFCKSGAQVVSDAWPARRQIYGYLTLRVGGWIRLHGYCSYVHRWCARHKRWRSPIPAVTGPDVEQLCWRGRCRYTATPNRHHILKSRSHHIALIELNWPTWTTLWVRKKQDTKLLPITSPNVNRFSEFFTARLSSNFATNACLYIPPRIEHVATLPCEIWMSENWRQSEMCIVVNDKWQGSIAKHLSYDGLLVKYATQCAGERIFFLNWWTFGKVTDKMVDCFMRSIRLALFPQICRTRHISRITCAWRTKTVTNHCHINQQIYLTLLSTDIKILQTSFDVMTNRLTPSATDRLLIMYGILVWYSFLCCRSCVQWIMRFLIRPM